jgi:peptidoglycan/LPS O-acetylase OafA/YrhL
LQAVAIGRFQAGQLRSQAMGWSKSLYALVQQTPLARRIVLPRELQPATELAAAPVRLDRHIPTLDSVRGLAIVLVTLYRFGKVEPDLPLAHHWLFELLQLGTRGVDLFFVLSGFLITGILFDAKGKPGYFRNFYMRRSLRIFPLYYGSLLLFLVLLPLALGSQYTLFAEARERQAWLWLYGANVLQGVSGEWNLGYFDHFWSLAVEEHFYFIWPLVIFCCNRKQAMWACGITCGLALATRTAWIVATGNGVAMDVWTPFRMDGLALGGWLALALRGPGGTQRITAWARPAMIVLGGLIVGLYVRSPGGRLLGLPYSLYAAFFGALILVALTSRPGTLAGRFWNGRVLRFFGKYSYAMYVFQNLLIPILAGWISVAGSSQLVGSFFWGRLAYIASMTAATVLVALASWNLYEKHFLRLKQFFGGHT